MAKRAASPAEAGDEVDGGAKRWRPTQAQKDLLVRTFEVGATPDAAKISELSLQLGLPQRQIRIWFQNRRQRSRPRPEPDIALLPEDQQTNAVVMRLAAAANAAQLAAPPLPPAGWGGGAPTIASGPPRFSTPRADAAGCAGGSTTGGSTAHQQQHYAAAQRAPSLAGASASQPRPSPRLGDELAQPSYELRACCGPVTRTAAVGLGLSRALVEAGRTRPLSVTAGADEHGRESFVTLSLAGALPSRGELVSPSVARDLGEAGRLRAYGPQHAVPPADPPGGAAIAGRDALGHAPRVQAERAHCRHEQQAERPATPARPPPAEPSAFVGLAHTANAFATAAAGGGAGRAGGGAGGAGGFGTGRPPIGIGGGCGSAYAQRVPLAHAPCGGPVTRRASSAAAAGSGVHRPALSVDLTLALDDVLAMIDKGQG
ncbi:hypothetical protein KFE25_012082 [Diacronema lutheri]|uniref:Homeobox domain-containing protein n=1 Tax=Diacronema lutheri TaxID=2081491 RepID=A0A8J6C533_DIALT|nr:hypothetical protein KFE25_012082 [Diacronema lutheri]